MSEEIAICMPGEGASNAQSSPTPSATRPAWCGGRVKYWAIRSNSDSILGLYPMAGALRVELFGVCRRACQAGVARGCAAVFVEFVAWMERSAEVYPQVSGLNRAAGFSSSPFKGEVGRGM